MTIKYDENFAVVSTNKVYAAIHQIGGDAGRNKKVKIPARPYLKLEEQSLVEVKGSILKYLKE